MTHLSGVLLVAALAAGSSKPAGPTAQVSPGDEVKTVVHQALDALASRDVAAVESVFEPSAVLLIVSYQPANAPIAAIPIKGIAAQLSAAGPKRREIVRNEKVFVTSDLATLTADYVFYFDDTAHHCGAAMYDLVRSQNRWRIVQIRQTDRREGCGR